MKTPIIRSIIVALSIAVVALGIYVVHLRRLVGEERLQLAEGQSSLPSADSIRVASAPPPGDTMANDHRTQLEPGASDPIYGEVSGTSQNSRVQPVLEKAGPEEVQKALVRQRAFLPIKFPDLGEALGLDSKQVNDLFDLFTQQASRFQGGPGLNGGGDPVQAYLRLYQAEEDEIARLLGSKYPLWRKYKDETPVREQMNDLRIVLSAENKPLNPALADAMRMELITAQKQISQQHPPGLSTMREANFYTIENIQTLSEIASRYLTPEQLSSYKQLLERTAGRKRLGLTAPAGAK